MVDFLEVLEQAALLKSTRDASPRKPPAPPIDVNEDDFETWLKSQGQANKKPAVIIAREKRITEFHAAQTSFRAQFETESDWAVACLLKHYQMLGDVGCVLDLIDAGIIDEVCNTPEIRLRFEIEAVLIELKKGEIITAELSEVIYGSRCL